VNVLQSRFVQRRVRVDHQPSPHLVEEVFNSVYCEKG
jgi:hypothetical protein